MDCFGDIWTFVLQDHLALMMELVGKMPPKVWMLSPPGNFELYWYLF